ncbi:outer membrane protein [Kaistia terrae]|uniref:Outer membrane protein n=1 Tax=Kaistia terrae TaxID=537017 RepID=A0ABW0PUK8_9HYPH|nr:outer membrane protein [Kaistia terrae]MCX5576700.1 porin family protein [Kaistia terrae]
MNALRLATLISASALALGVTAAQAADLTYEPAPAPIVEAAPAAFNWTGFYLGVHAGAALLDGDYNDVDFGGFSGDNTGFIGGVQAGYNWQFDNIVIGAQTDFAYTSAKISDDAFGAENKLEWLGSTTARVGYAFDNFLVYGKGGVAYGQSKIDDAVLSVNDSQWHVGWTAGVGAEYAFTQNITGLLEYNYVDLGSQDYFNDAVSADLTTNVIKAGLNYKF